MKDQFEKLSEEGKSIIKKIRSSKKTQEILKELFNYEKRVNKEIFRLYSIDPKTRTAKDPVMQEFLNIIEENRGEIVPEIFELAYKGEINSLAYSNVLAKHIKKKSPKAKANALLQHLRAQSLTAAEITACSCVGCVGCTGCLGCLGCLSCIGAGTWGAFSIFSVASSSSSASSASTASATQKSS